MEVNVPWPEVEEALMGPVQAEGIDGDPYPCKEEVEAEADGGQLEGGAVRAVGAQPHCLQGPHHSSSCHQHISKPHLHMHAAAGQA